MRAERVSSGGHSKVAPASLMRCFARLNPTVGDIAGNLARVHRVAAELSADLVVFSELILVGYRR